MKEATAVAAALAKKVIVPQAGVTRMNSEITATSVAVSATVGAAVAAVESVAVALAVNCKNGAVLGEIQLLVSFLMEETRKHLR